MVQIKHRQQDKCRQHITHDQKSVLRKSVHQIRNRQEVGNFSFRGTIQIQTVEFFKTFPDIAPVDHFDDGDLPDPPHHDRRKYDDQQDQHKGYRKSDLFHHQRIR